MLSICNNCIVFIDCGHIAILCFSLSSSCLCTGRSLVVLLCFMLLILITKKNSIRFSVAIKNRTEIFFFFFFLFFSLRPLSSFLQRVSCFWAIASVRRVENRIDAEKSKSGSNSYWYPVGADAHGRVLLCSRKRLWNFVLKNSFNRYLSKPTKLLC